MPHFVGAEDKAADPRAVEQSAASWALRVDVHHGVVRFRQNSGVVHARHGSDDCSGLEGDALDVVELCDVAWAAVEAVGRGEPGVDDVHRCCPAY